MAPLIVFRCDGASLPEIGTGHITRMLGLANKIVEYNPRLKRYITFVSRNDGAYSLGYKILSRSDYHVSSGGRELAWNSKSELNFLKHIGPKIIVIDRLNCDQEWIAELKTLDVFIVAFDDCGSNGRIADITINGILSDPYSVSPYCGYEYLLLRANSYRSQYKLKESVKNITATFGGYDHRELSNFFLDALINFSDKFENKINLELNLIVGNELYKKTQACIDRIERLQKKGWSRINILTNPKNFYEKLLEADALISAGGITMFEALSIGIPTIALPQYLHQLESIQKLAELGGVLTIEDGGCRNHEGLVKVLLSLVGDYHQRVRLSEYGRSLVDGNGDSRVMKLLEPKLSEFKNI